MRRGRGRGIGTFSVVCPAVELSSREMSPFFHFDGLRHTGVTDIFEEAFCEDHVGVWEISTWIWGAIKSIRLSTSGHLQNSEDRERSGQGKAVRDREERGDSG